MISKKWLVQITESSIDNLLKTFTRMPYFFYTENDLHTCLYHEIFNNLPLEEWRCTTKVGKSSILLHKEYPTKMRYAAKTLEENAPRGTRGHFDLSIWNPENARERLFRVDHSADFMREQQTFIAIEFNLTERSASLKDAVHHFRWDLMKLGPNNEVEHGYQLVFVRDWLYGKRFLQEVRDHATKAYNTAVLYIEKGKEGTSARTLAAKPFFGYQSAFK